MTQPTSPAAPPAPSATSHQLNYLIEHLTQTFETYHFELTTLLSSLPIPSEAELTKVIVPYKYIKAFLHLAQEKAAEDEAETNHLVFKDLHEDLKRQAYEKVIEDEEMSKLTSRVICSTLVLHPNALSQYAPRAPDTHPSTTFQLLHGLISTLTETSKRLDLELALLRSPTEAELAQRILEINYIRIFRHLACETAGGDENVINYTDYDELYKGLHDQALKTVEDGQTQTWL